MPALLQRYATPLITGLFLVSLISGVALFFHVGQAAFHGMHEWLSMVLIAPFALHLWKNWRPMKLYFAKPAFAGALAVSLAMAAPFAIEAASGRSGGPPQFALVHSLFARSPAELAPALKSNPAALIAKLKTAGFNAASPDHTLADIATLSGKSEAELATVLATINGGTAP